MSVASVHTYLICDLMTNQILAEAQLTGVRYSKKLCATGQLTASLNVGAARSDGIDPHDLTTPGRRVLYVLRDDVPVWAGLIWTRRYDSAAHRITLGCGDFWSYFDHRKVLPKLSPEKYDCPHYIAQLQPVQWIGVDQNLIVRNLLTLAAGHPGGDIGIAVAESGASMFPRSVTYYGYQNVSVGDALRRLSQLKDGPDLMFDAGPIDGGGRPTRLLRLGAPRLGATTTAHVWEYGGNMTGYTWPSDATRMATRTFATGAGTGQQLLIAVAEDADRYRSGWPLLETEHGYTSVSGFGELRSYAAADLQAGRLPVALPTLAVHSGLPPRLSEVQVGDQARVIIRDAFHTNGIDAVMRIVGIEVVVGDHGDDQVTFTMNSLIEEAI